MKITFHLLSSQNNWGSENQSLARKEYFSKHFKRKRQKKKKEREIYIEHAGTKRYKIIQFKSTQ